MCDVVLKSGREVKLKPLTAIQRWQIQDLSQAFLAKNPDLVGKGLSMEALGRSVQFSVGNVDDWTTEEIIECGLQVWEDSFFSETDKKK